MVSGLCVPVVEVVEEMMSEGVQVGHSSWTWVFNVVLTYCVRESATTEGPVT